jgi:hypothetical protein
MLSVCTLTFSCYRYRMNCQRTLWLSANARAVNQRHGAEAGGTPKRFTLAAPACYARKSTEWGAIS